MTELEIKARNILAEQYEKSAQKCAMSGGLRTYQSLMHKASDIRMGNRLAIPVKAIMVALTSVSQH